MGFLTISSITDKLLCMLVFEHVSNPHTLLYIQLKHLIICLLLITPTAFCFFSYNKMSHSRGSVAESLTRLEFQLDCNFAAGRRRCLRAPRPRSINNTPVHLFCCDAAIRRAAWRHTGAAGTCPHLALTVDLRHHSDYFMTL